MSQHVARCWFWVFILLLMSFERPFFKPTISSAHRFADSVSGWYSGRVRAPCLVSPGDKGQHVKGERLSDIWGQTPWQSSKASSLCSLPQRERKSCILTGRDGFKKTLDYGLMWPMVTRRCLLLFFPVCLTFSHLRVCFRAGPFRAQTCQPFKSFCLLNHDRLPLTPDSAWINISPVTKSITLGSTLLEENFYILKKEEA